MKLKLNQLSCNPDLQVREQVFDFGVVEDYAEAMKAGTVFPPITVFFDGTTYWLADGFHRYAAAQQAKLEDIEADVRDGSKRDAILYAVGANADNGLRRTNQDKHNAIMKLLNDKEWSGWTDNYIAKVCKVDNETVTRLRPKSSLAETQVRERKYIDRYGNESIMNTANIGKQSSPVFEPKPIIRTPAADSSQKQYAPITETPLPAWAHPEETEVEEDEQAVVTCGDCRFYKPDGGTDQFYCLALERIYYYDGTVMPCNGKKYKQYQLGFCECCGQKLP